MSLDEISTSVRSTRLETAYEAATQIMLPIVLNPKFTIEGESTMYSSTYLCLAVDPCLPCVLPILFLTGETFLASRQRC